MAGSSTIGEALTTLTLGHAHGAVLIVVGNVDAETCRVNVAVAKNEKSTENGLGADVKDTVEDRLSIGGDKVATFAETEGNWVEAPKEESPGAAHDEDLADVAA